MPTEDVPNVPVDEFCSCPPLPGVEREVKTVHPPRCGTCGKVLKGVMLETEGPAHEGESHFVKRFEIQNLFTPDLVEGEETPIVVVTVAGLPRPLALTLEGAMALSQGILQAVERIGAELKRRRPNVQVFKLLPKKEKPHG